MHYLDNAATSYPKPECVLEALGKASTIPGNPHRSSISERDATYLLYNSRNTIAEFFGIVDSQRLAFTYNCTYALNMVLFGFLRKNSHVIVDGMSHNAVVRPLEQLVRGRKIQITRLNNKPTGQIDLEELEDVLRKSADLLIINHVSNVNGAIQPLRRIGELAQANKVPLLVDGAQSSGVVPIDVIRDNISFFTFSGHKGLYGPPGIGGLYVAPGIELVPLMHGGTGGALSEITELAPWPERIEVGTQNFWGAAALSEGIRFLKQNCHSLNTHKREMERELVHKLAQMPEIQVYLPPNDLEETGIVLFNVKGQDPIEVGNRLTDEFGIITRAGIHCAPWAHQVIGTFPSGAIRVSFGYGNSFSQIGCLIDGLKEIVRR